MWEFAARFILRNRIVLLIVIGLITAFMGYQAQFVEMTYKFGGILPKDDSTQMDYDSFTERFAEDGNVLILGVQGEELFKLENFAAWYELGINLKKINGIDSIFSEAHAYKIVKDTAEKRFAVEKIVNQKPQSQAEVDSIRRQVRSLPFYRDMLYNDSTDASLMMLFVNRDVFNSEERVAALDEAMELIDEFSENHMDIATSGLPYIRTIQTAMIKRELGMFVGLAALVMAIMLYLFFKSVRVVLVSLLVVIVGVIWSMGSISLLAFKLSVLMGLIPPLIIVIGIPNCVFLLNKYHQEYKNHGNQVKSLARVIQKVGNATFMTNTTTAMGFATFIFTQSAILQEFGVVASINILCVFLLSLIILPSIMSFLPPPIERHTKHLDRKWLDKAVGILTHLVSNKRKIVYIITLAVIGIGIYGVTLVKATGNIVDDLPEDDQIIVDLGFFERNFSGVMPLEILIESKNKGGVTKDNTLKRIERLQNELNNHPEISKSLSIVDAIKFAKQAYYNGAEQKYSLLNSYEKSFIGPYIQGNKNDGAGISQLFLDSTQQVTRVTAQIADIGTMELDSLMADLKPAIAEIFPSDQYTITLTGTSIVFLMGTTYLVKNLFVSLAIAIVIIACIMALLFSSFRMVIISLVPNLIPLLCTAAIMGYFNIAIKPSTILVFSIAFGISIDDTIHFLSKYRMELKLRPWNLRLCILNAVKETGASMIYTSVILFFGFGIFAASKFGGTIALGILVSVTLLIAMLSNLILLPSLLMSLQRMVITKSFREPLLEITDEEEDIDLESLEIRKDEAER